MSDKRRAYEEKFDTQLKEWDAEIALLKAKTKFQELKTSGDEAWEAVKGNAEKTWAEVKAAYHDAVSKFK
jgi:hypothetical protein